MKHVLTPTPLPPHNYPRAEWLDAAFDGDTPALPKQERVPDPPEGYHKAAYGTLAFYKERAAWREMHGSTCVRSMRCCSDHAGDVGEAVRHLEQLFGIGFDATAMMDAALGKLWDGPTYGAPSSSIASILAR